MVIQPSFPVLSVSGKRVRCEVILVFVNTLTISVLKPFQTWKVLGAVSVARVSALVCFLYVRFCCTHNIFETHTVCLPVENALVNTQASRLDGFSCLNVGSSIAPVLLFSTFRGQKGVDTVFHVPLPNRGKTELHDPLSMWIELNGQLSE